MIRMGSALLTPAAFVCGVAAFVFGAAFVSRAASSATGATAVASTPVSETASLAAAPPARRAAAPAKPSLNAYFPAHFKDVPYQQAAVQKVLKNWKAPAKRPDASRKTVVQSKIGRDGKLAAAVVSMKTGIQEWDDAALAAVQKAQPFPAFPKGFPDSQIEVHWHFSMAP